MRKAIVNNSVDIMIRKGIIDNSDRELYVFGVNQLFLFLVNVGTSVVIGAICGMIVESLIFSAAYIPLRKFAGGYHANTAGRCYCLSVILILCVLLFMKYVHLSVVIGIAILSISIFTILLRAPVQSLNKPLNEAEKKAFRKKAISILLLETGLIAVLGMISMMAVKCVAAAIVCSAIMLIIPSKE